MHKHSIWKKFCLFSACLMMSFAALPTYADPVDDASKDQTEESTYEDDDQYITVDEQGKMIDTRYVQTIGNGVASASQMEEYYKSQKIEGEIITNPGWIQASYISLMSQHTDLYTKSKIKKVERFQTAYQNQYYIAFDIDGKHYVSNEHIRANKEFEYNLFSDDEDSYKFVVETSKLIETVDDTDDIVRLINNGQMTDKVEVDENGKIKEESFHSLYEDDSEEFKPTSDKNTESNSKSGLSSIIFVAFACGVFGLLIYVARRKKLDNGSWPNV